MDSGPVATFHIHDYLRPKVTYLPRIWLYGRYFFSDVFVSVVNIFSLIFISCVIYMTTILSSTSLSVV